jgi:mannobiose 2-epimerase
MLFRNILVFFLLNGLFLCTPKNEAHKPSMKTRLENILNKHTLQLWYPKLIDKNNGGYYTNFSFDWKKGEIQNKFIVTQARHIWTLSKAFDFYPKRNNYLEFANHGYEFLRDNMWDEKYGGFYQLVDSTGMVPEGEYTFEKRLYGNSFAIYSLAANYKTSENVEVLELSKEAFWWLDTHARDTTFGGYFQYLKRDGAVIPRSALSQGYNAPDKDFVGLKDYNSSIHILEAFTELYQVWPDETLKARLVEMYEIVSNTMYDPRGFLKLYFHPDWTLVQDQEMKELMGERSIHTNHVTFGHDVETAFLLLEAAEALGIDHHKILPKAKLLVDHAIEKGWDDIKGGFYEQGKYIDGEMSILDKGKNWWAQSEGINSLLIMHRYFPDDANQYYNKFELLVDYIDQNMIDHQHLGWYAGGIDHNPDLKKGDKAQIWKGTYHTSRSLMRCISTLEKMGI